MAMRKTLINILFGALVLGGAGCVNNPEYVFNGKIGEEKVKYCEADIRDTNILEVTKADGSKIEYLDFYNNFKIDRVIVNSTSNRVVYCADSKNPIVTEIIKKEQKKFEAYLAKIIEINTAPLNKD